MRGDADLVPEPDRGATPARSRSWLVARALVSAGVALVLLRFALPRVTGARWSEICTVLGGLTSPQIGVLTVVWAVGPLGYTWVLTGGLPGLTHAQALTLNLSSSSVSNLVPFGGAFGVAVSFVMIRSWGFRPSAFALMTLVTGIWNVLAKLALPVLALLALLVFGEVRDRRLLVVSGAATVMLATAGAAVAGALLGERFARTLGRLVERVADAGRWMARRRRHRRDDGEPWSGRVQDEALVLRERLVGLLRRRWHHLTFGMATFLGAQAVLQWLCLRMLGSGLNPVQVFAGFAFGRLLTAVVVTPGGVGISETGAAAVLVTVFGGDPAVTVSGVLLFSGYAYFLEIAAGGPGYVIWALRRSWRRPRDWPLFDQEEDGRLGG